MLKLLKSIHRLRGKNSSDALDVAAAQPEMSQRRFLSNLLRKNANSIFGKQHNFSAIHDETDFRRNVPVRDYEDFRPFINKIIAGEKSVLTRENPFMFTMTSGTTGEPKYIPVTRESQKSNSALMTQWLYRAELDHKGLTAKASVGIVSRATEGFTSGGLPYGSVSGLIYQNIPWFIRRAYAVPYSVSEIEDYDARYFALARFALASDVSFIATPNPGTLLRFAQVCVDNQEKLVRCINDGTSGFEGCGQSKIHDELSRKLRPNPIRAKFLANAIAKNGCLRLTDCWENLKLIGCWLGGSGEAQAKKLNAHFGAIPHRDLGFLASEGHFTVPISDQTATGILAVNNAYYEFTAESESESKQPTILTASELKINERYNILLTTSAGLYRYKIGDIVEVTGFHRRTPLIAFVRKAGEMTNIIGEKMHANHITLAFEQICRQFDLKIEQFCAVPNHDFSRYDIYIELQKDYPVNKLRDEVSPETDRALMRVNIEYEQKRKSKRLAAPHLFLMKSGWAKEELRRHIAAGKRDTQYKRVILRPEFQTRDAAFIVPIVESTVVCS
ncbi:MAG: GH3 auxin-responsive promoter family protein [Pyrinomonadaceae bacterium]|nr:GH3 auxin-responsive promoter family protein [Pyrinomonadaceae bacterium]